MSQSRPAPIWVGYLLGLIAASALVLLGGEDNIYALGLAVLFPGALFLLHPPAWGISPGVDRAALIFLALFLAAFIPQFYWPDADWREAATAVGIDLPAMLSVQPRISMEVWLQCAAAIAWLYAIYAWPLNDNGRRWFFFSFSCVFAVFALIVIWGNLYSLRYPGSGATGAFSFFSEWSQTAGFLAMGGVACFAYAARDLQSGAVTPLMGLFASGLCFGALLLPVSTVGLLLFFGGLFVWYLWRIRSRPKMGPLPKFGLPIFFILFAVFYTPNLVPGDADRLELRSHFSGLRVAVDAPLTGVGLGNFDAVWPQYAESAGQENESQTGMTRLVAEVGLFGLAAALFLLWAYFRSWRHQLNARGIGLRLAALFGVSVFLIHFLIANSGHEVGFLYMAGLLAAAALPSPTRNLALPRIFWRVLGGLLVLVGGLWVFAGMTGIPAHSVVALARQEARVKEASKFGDHELGFAAADAWLALKPLDWRAYHWRAKFVLAGSGEIERAATLFEQARIAEPSRGLVPFEEGFVWLPYNRERAALAWHEAFSRGMEAPEAAFRRILKATDEDSSLLLALSKVSRLDPEFRVLYLERLSGQVLMSEINDELSESPSLSQFSKAQRTRLLERWIAEGDVVTADRFLDQWGEGLDSLWWLRSVSKKAKADFAGAVELIRENLPAPVLPELELESNGLVRTQREFSINSSDSGKGLLLFQFYFEAGDYRDALSVCELMREGEGLSTRLHYWRAECLYRIGDFVESWFAFEEYIEKAELASEVR